MFSFDEAVSVIEKVKPAIEAIRTREAELRDAATRLSNVEKKCAEAHATLNAHSATIQDLERKVSVKRDELAKVTAEYDAVYAQRQSEFAQLHAIRQSYVELQQKLR